MRLSIVYFATMLSAALFSLSAPAHAQWDKVGPVYRYYEVTRHGNGAAVTKGTTQPGLGAASDWFGGTAVLAKTSATVTVAYEYDGTIVSSTGHSGAWTLEFTIDADASGTGQVNSNGVAHARSSIEVTHSDDELGMVIEKLEGDTLSHTELYPNPYYEQPKDTMFLIVSVEPLSSASFAKGDIIEMPSDSGNVIMAESNAGPSSTPGHTYGSHSSASAISYMYMDAAYTQ